MKVCLACGAKFEKADWMCPLCFKEPVFVGAHPAFSPELAYTEEGFKSEFFEFLFKIEENNFWFRSREHLILWAVKKYFTEAKSLFEIGCGTGFVLSGIERAFPDMKLFGSDINIKGLEFASERLKRSELIQMDARKIPFEKEFDVIGAFDVLEHIEDDEQVLMQMRKALKPRGVMLLTVPMHTWLWSPVDDYSCHVRRYSAKELRAKVEGAGFEILRSTSFVSSLLPVMWASRFAQKSFKRDVDAMAESRISPWLNRIFEKILGAEVYMIRNGVNFALGGSRLIVAKNYDEHPL